MFEAPASGEPPEFAAMPAATEPASGDWLDRQCQTFYGLRGLDDLVARRVFDRPAGSAGAGWTGINSADAAARGGGGHFYLTDPQGSALLIVTAAGQVAERVSYSAYGLPTHTWPVDVDGSGQVDPDDSADYTAWFFSGPEGSTPSIGMSGYDVDMDLALRGAPDPDDLSDFITAFYADRPTIEGGSAVAADLTALHHGGGRGPGGTGSSASAPSYGPDGSGLADNIFGWCGYVYNQSTQQYTVRHREFDPRLGRWLQRDPAGFVDSMNLYEYGGGHPVGRTDPLGLFTVFGHDINLFDADGWRELGDMLTGAAVEQDRQWAEAMERAYVTCMTKNKERGKSGKEASCNCKHLLSNMTNAMGALADMRIGEANAIKATAVAVAGALIGATTGFYFAGAGIEMGFLGAVAFGAAEAAIVGTYGDFMYGDPITVGSVAEHAAWGAAGAAVGYAIGRAAQVVRQSGRLGSPATRSQITRIQNELRARGWKVTHGGTLGEEYIPGLRGGRRGSAYPDITAVKNGRVLRINTVDTLVDGSTPTAREARNAAKIRRLRPDDHLLLIPKARS